MWSRFPGKYLPRPDTARRRQWRVSRAWEWNLSWPRRKPAMAPGWRRHPGARYPRVSPSRGGTKRKLRTRRGRQRYALRLETVEPVFGQIKQGRGFRQFLLRGLEKVNRLWPLICTGHNLLKLFRSGRPPSGQGGQEVVCRSRRHPPGTFSPP